MIGQVIGYRMFPDGALRIIYEDNQGQYIVNDDGQRVYGVWFIPDMGAFKLPLTLDWPTDMTIIKRGY